MERFRDKRIYKSRAPEETVEIVRGIVESLGFSCMDTRFRHEELKVFSCGVNIMVPGFDKYALLHTNGKGASESYSLASGYGELMERLQGMQSHSHVKPLLDRKFDFRFAPDERYMTYGELDDASREVIGTILGHGSASFEDLLAAAGDGRKLFIPYYDFTAGKQVMLPAINMQKINGSNGLCAGNTPREAIAQGLSELFERYAMRVEYYRNPDVPVLDSSLFDGTEAEKYIRLTEERGFSCEILDLSLGRGFPAIGLRLKGEAGTAVHFGADPNPVVALMRNFTEIYQGQDELTFLMRFLHRSCGVYADCDTQEKRDAYDHNFERAYGTGIARKPDNLFYPSGIRSEEYRWNSGDVDDFDYYERLIRDSGMHLLVRDCSFLGFPAYSTIIPELPPVFLKDRRSGRSLLDLLACDFRMPNLEREMLEIYDAALPVLDARYAANVPEQSGRMLDKNYGAL